MTLHVGVLAPTPTSVVYLPLASSVSDEKSHGLILDPFPSEPEQGCNERFKP